MHDLLEGSLRLAELYYERQRVDEAIKLIDDCLPVAEKLLRGDPDNAVAQDDLARTLSLHAYTLVQTGRAADAVAPMERALAMRRAMADAHGELGGRSLDDPTRRDPDRRTLHHSR